MKRKDRGKVTSRRGLANSSGVKAKLVRIGNSRGVRIPKILLEQSGLSDSVTLRVSGNSIIVEGTDDPRAGWDEAMREAVAEHGNELTAEDRDWIDAPLNAAFNEET
jgi:antitoxin MazE